MAGVVSWLPPEPADQPYHLLQPLPRELWRWAVVCHSGDAPRRLPDLEHWRQALLAGALPMPSHDFGDPEATGVLRQAMGELELTELTHGSAAMTVQVLQSVMWHLDHLIDRPPSEERRLAIARMRDEFHQTWNQQRQGWEEVLSLLQTLGDLAHLRWDELQGRLNSREWQQAWRIGQRLQDLPGLTAFIDGVGRRAYAGAPEASPLVPDPQHPPLASPHWRPEEDRTPEPSSVDGVRRSREIARMAGAESLNLTHPTLRKLWRARFAEARLLTYDDRAPRNSIAPRHGDASDATQAEPVPTGMGPMIICLDTSGSMRGAPENIAKACVLHALRSAQTRNRACKLLAFGGPGELLEHDLGSTPEGLDALLATMGQSFDGGTDVQNPIERGVQRVHAEHWQDADLLIVSDGEFGVTPGTLALLREAKASKGLRVHGILIGDRETIGLLEVCDHIHWVRDWRRHGDEPSSAGEGFSPVHSRSLTALYFPNAMRR